MAAVAAIFGFQIDTILAHFNPEVVLLLQNKFWLKLTKGLGKDVKNCFFKMEAVADAPHEVSTQLDHSF